MATGDAGAQGEAQGAEYTGNVSWNGVNVGAVTSSQSILPNAGSTQMIVEAQEARPCQAMPVAGEILSMAFSEVTKPSDFSDSDTWVSSCVEVSTTESASDNLECQHLLGSQTLGIQPPFIKSEVDESGELYFKISRADLSKAQSMNISLDQLFSKVLDSYDSQNCSNVRAINTTLPQLTNTISSVQAFHSQESSDHLQLSLPESVRDEEKSAMPVTVNQTVPEVQLPDKPEFVGTAQDQVSVSGQLTVQSGGEHSHSHDVMMTRDRKRKLEQANTDNGSGNSHTLEKRAKNEIGASLDAACPEGTPGVANKKVGLIRRLSSAMRENNGVLSRQVSWELGSEDLKILFDSEDGENSDLMEIVTSMLSISRQNSQTDSPVAAPAVESQFPEKSYTTLDPLVPVLLAASGSSDKSEAETDSGLLSLSYQNTPTGSAVVIPAMESHGSSWKTNTVIDTSMQKLPAASSSSDKSERETDSHVSEYQLRRMKNNVASRKSRQKAKGYHAEMEKKAEALKAQNRELTNTIKRMEEAVMEMRRLLVQNMLQNNHQVTELPPS